MSMLLRRLRFQLSFRTDMLKLMIAGLWTRFQIRLKGTMRRWLGLEGEMTVIANFIREHDRLIIGQRTDHDAFVEAMKILRQIDHGLINSAVDMSRRVERRLNYYDHHCDSLKFTARQFDKMLVEEKRESKH